MNATSADVDPAAIFASALSLWTACQNAAEKDAALNYSEAYNGTDELMRVIMRIATMFETWSSSHIAFDELNEVWPYILESRLGSTCLSLMEPTSLSYFEESDCLRVAMRLALPIEADGILPIPVTILAVNPSPGAFFCEFQIQTMRLRHEDRIAVPFVPPDEPFDEEFDVPFFALFGVTADGKKELITTRPTLSEIHSLALKLTPGLTIPDRVVFSLHPFVC